VSKQVQVPLIILPIYPLSIYHGGMLQYLTHHASINGHELGMLSQI